MGLVSDSDMEHPAPDFFGRIFILKANFVNYTTKVQKQKTKHINKKMEK